VDVSREHIEIVQGELGPKPRIKGSRIRVEDVVGWHVQQGMPVSEMVEQFPAITQADIYAALAYYWDHKDELERIWAEGDAWVREAYRDDVSPLEEKLKQQRVG
jgi:uncharacterized protein (DUF433 family)